MKSEKTQKVSTIVIASVCVVLGIGGIAFAIQNPSVANADEVAPFAESDITEAAFDETPPANEENLTTTLENASADVEEIQDQQAAEGHASLTEKVAEEQAEVTTPSEEAQPVTSEEQPYQYSASTYVAPAQEEAVVPEPQAEVEVYEPQAQNDSIDTSSSGLAPGTLNIAGTIVTYGGSYMSSSAPASGGGLWMGSDSTTDGTWGYFIGHNPGSFSCVMGLGVGSPVTVCDSNGNERTYYAVDTFTVPDTSYFEDISGRVTGYGESIILQTCCGDNANYRIVVCQ